MSLQQIRERRGWSQADLARETELSKGFISMLESGDRQLIGKTIRQLAAVFGMSLDRFVKELEK